MLRALHECLDEFAGGSSFKRSCSAILAQLHKIGRQFLNHFPLTAADKPDRPLAAGTISPAVLAERLAELRVHPSELTGDILRLFVPDWQKVDQDKDKSLLTSPGLSPRQ